MEPQQIDCPFCGKWDCLIGNVCSLCGCVFHVEAPIKYRGRPKTKTDDDTDDTDTTEAESPIGNHPDSLQEPQNHLRDSQEPFNP